MGKPEILKRIEEDRERVSLHFPNNLVKISDLKHKRVKEEQWIRRGSFDDEFYQQWDELSDFNDKDQAYIEEWNRQRAIPNLQP
jgi:hypothetical protein